MATIMAWYGINALFILSHTISCFCKLSATLIFLLVQISKLHVFTMFSHRFFCCMQHTHTKTQPFNSHPFFHGEIELTSKGVIKFKTGLH